MCLSRNLFTSAKLSNLLALKFFILFPFIIFYFYKIIGFYKIYFCKLIIVSNLSPLSLFVVSPANSLLILLIFSKKSTFDFINFLYCFYSSSCLFTLEVFIFSPSVFCVSFVLLLS